MKERCTISAHIVNVIPSRNEHLITAITASGCFASYVNEAGPSQRRKKMNTVQNVLENETCLFGLFGIAVILIGCWFWYIVREWSWMPRKKQRTRFNERLGG